MPNGIEPEGDDQKWKREVDRVIEELKRQLQVLKTQTGKN